MNTKSFCKGENMEIIKLGKDAIKVMLDKNETNEYNFSSDEQAGKKSLKNLIEILRADEILGTEGARLCTEIYVSNDGCSEIFISKGEERAIKRHGTARLDGEMYKFDSLSNLAQACARLKMINHKGKSFVYYDKEAKKYYLRLTHIAHKELKYAFLSEYALKQKPSLTLYIVENSRCICEKNSIEIFASLL